MSRRPLKYISTATHDSLVTEIQNNLDRYRSGDFQDLVEAGGWSIELKYRTDLSPLSDLDPSGTPSAEVENSIKVWQALYDLSPALASENRIWTRLSHIDCLDYSRRRWSIPDNDDEAVKSVKKHFFAPTLNGCRDDHAVSRLWWNARIAKILRPHDQKRALELFLARADLRSNFVERSVMVSRPVIGSGILRLMERDSWVTKRDEHFRELMKSVNLLGSGIVFEFYSATQIDDFLRKCCERATELLAIRGT